MDDDLQILTLPYSNDLSTLFSQINNCFAIVLIVFQFLLLISTLILSFVVSLLPNKDKTSRFLSTNSFEVAIIAHLILWSIIHLIRYYIRSVYYKRLRVLGYYVHNQRVKTLSVIPSLVLNKSIAFLLLLATLFTDYEKEIQISSSIRLKAINLVQIIISIAVLIITPFLVKWLYHEIRFRKDRNPPDIFCVEDPQHLVTSAGLNDIGVRPSSYVEDLLEKQAELIYNLKLQNTHLRQMLYKVTQTSNRESLQTN